MNWDFIRTFIAVVDTGSLSGASERLGISQPSVGRHITELETSLDVTLFTRGRSGMILSEAGLRLIDDARAMSYEADQFALKAASNKSRIKGTVRITASEFISAYILPSILCALRDAEPEIDIELIATDSTDNLLSRDADLAIRMFRPTQNDLITRKVNKLSLGTYATQEYLQKFGTPFKPEDLNQHRMVGYDRKNIILDGMKAMGLSSNRDMFAYRTDNPLVYLQLVLSGAGVGFCANVLAKKHPELIAILPELQIPPLEMWLTTHQEVRTNLRIRRTVDFLADSLTKLSL
ncbi:LysR family transcriptional regulator [Paraglaciecola marina]|uniref:LysR family transcriptional regulator n=1 Tax=Paraglaciecola marina TaxID=2500157 RepID=UPI00105DAC13|nr:LysR family transcriptional regulator [Paraglaciecola marina]